MSKVFAVAFALMAVLHGTAGNISFLFIDLAGLAIFGLLAVKGK
jgi:hypothetical protein